MISYNTSFVGNSNVLPSAPTDFTYHKSHFGFLGHLKASRNPLELATVPCSMLAIIVIAIDDTYQDADSFWGARTGKDMLNCLHFRRHGAHGIAER